MLLYQHSSLKLILINKKKNIQTPACSRMPRPTSQVTVYFHVFALLMSHM